MFIAGGFVRACCVMYPGRARIFRRENFFGELPHPILRSSVQRISVPSQTAEVSL